MGYHAAGDHLTGECLDINGKVVATYNYICFAGFFYKSFYYGRVKEETTLVRLHMKYNIGQRYMDYYLAELTKMGFQDNIKIDASYNVVTLSFNPKLVTAQEMFWVGTMVRLPCFLPDIVRSFCLIHKKTGFDAGKLIFLCHWFRRPRNETWYNSDHLPFSGCNPCKIVKGAGEMLEFIRKSHDTSLISVATSHHLIGGYSYRLKDISVAVTQTQVVIFKDVSQFKEYV